MRRRQFLGLVGAAGIAWPAVARAQQSGMPVVGILHSGTAEENADRLTQIRKGLSETGYTEGRNVALELRFANNQFKQLPALADELVRRPVTVLFAGGGSPVALAAKAATSSIPIVFQIGADPVEVGLVASLNRPEGNVTGIAAFSRDLVAKRLEIVRELVPNVAIVALLSDPTSPVAETRRKDFETAARTLGQRFDIVQASGRQEIDAAFQILAQRKIGAVVIQGAPRFSNARERIAALAAQHRIVAIYEQPESARAGGLISYGSSLTDASRLGGIYVGRILKGEKPTNIPVMLPAKIDLVINLKAATALGLTISREFLLRADEVIE